MVNSCISFLTFVSSGLDLGKVLLGLGLGCGCLKLKDVKVEDALVLSPLSVLPLYGPAVVAGRMLAQGNVPGFLYDTSLSGPWKVCRASWVEQEIGGSEFLRII